MLGIIGAMEEEVKKLQENMEEAEVHKKAGMRFVTGKLEGRPVVVVRSGIGKVNAALCTQILVDEYRVTGVINTGIAGSLQAKIDIGDIVLSTDVLQHDVDAAVFGYEPGQIPQMDVLAFPGDEEMRRLAAACCRKVNPEIQVYEGRVVSGDQFISSDEKKKWLCRKFAGFCTEMEGAAIGQASYLNQIPFLIIRAISDKADNSASMDYPEFEARAIEHTVKLVKAFVRSWQ
ncbi:MAG: 5'-methylthioadenosine/adenosylhomocysteine nucleosidase [Lachnospiraceae bacterium]|nr:5'-methylthioadenosine/adenosylhomocysteine nucleosidase [Lachnospiraceae bacterium]